MDLLYFSQDLYHCKFLVIECLLFGYFLVKHMLPQQQAMIDDFVKESRASRKIFVDAVEIMSRGERLLGGGVYR